MAGKRTYAILPCRALDEIAPLYAALGFDVTFRQERPNPYLVVRREDLRLHAGRALARLGASQQVVRYRVRLYVHRVSATDAFDEHAATYDAERRRLVPPYDDFYGTAVDALALAARPVRHVLDLGAGTGLLARHVAAAYPHAKLTLTDGAPAMLAQARQTFGDRASYIVADLAGELPGGPWDAIVTGLAVHHLPDDEKARLYRRVHAALAPGGVFVNAEQVAGPSSLFAELYARWHRDAATALGSTADEWKAAEERMAFDRWTTVERQLAWLGDAGFADVDCLYKHHRFAVLVARRAGGVTPPRDPPEP